MSDSSPDPQRDRDVMSPRDREKPGANPHEDGKWISAVVALLGLVLLAETIWTDPAVVFWNDLVTGGLLVVLGSYNYSRRADERVGSFGIATLVALLGLWLVISPFALGTADVVGAGDWTNLVVGALTVALGGYSAYEASKKPPNLTPG